LNNIESVAVDGLCVTFLITVAARCKKSSNGQSWA